MEIKAFWVVVDAVECVDVLSSHRPEANDLSLDTVVAIVRGPKKGEIHIYMCMFDMCQLNHD